MIIKSIKLNNFRSYVDIEFDFHKGINLLLGGNAVGKTNLLEAINLLSSGKSPRVKSEEEMIQSRAKTAHVEGRVLDNKNNKDILQISLTRGEIQGKRVSKKRYFINGAGRNMSKFIGRFKTVFFRPEDLQIILGSPSERRAYLDNVLVLSDYEYARNLLAYKKGLRQRNKVLLQVREGEANENQLYFWDKLLLKNGEYIHRQRQDLIGFINQCQTDKDLCLRLEYDHSVISVERLKQYKQASIASATTLVGPHRDDFRVFDKKRNLAWYGSRGEQRLAVLFLKLSELRYIYEKTEEKPVLLLDDIFSELDHKHRELVLSVVEKHQSILSSTESDWLDSKFLDRMNIIKVSKIDNEEVKDEN